METVYYDGERDGLTLLFTKRSSISSADNSGLLSMEEKDNPSEW